MKKRIRIVVTSIFLIVVFLFSVLSNFAAEIRNHSEIGLQEAISIINEFSKDGIVFSIQEKNSVEKCC